MAEESNTLPENGFAEFGAKVLRKSTYAIIEWFAHCLVVGSILVGMRLLHWLMEYLWQGKTLLFFDSITPDQVFQTADFCLLVGILTLGVACVVNAYRGK